MLRRTLYWRTTLAEARKLLFDTRNHARAAPITSLASVLNILHEHHKHAGEELVSATLRHLVQLDCTDDDTRLIASARLHPSTSASTLSAEQPFLVLQTMRAYPHSAHIRECCCRCIANMCQLDRSSVCASESTNHTSEDYSMTRSSSYNKYDDAAYNASAVASPSGHTSLADALVRQGAVEQVLGTLSMTARLSPRGRCWATMALLNLMCLSSSQPTTYAHGEGTAVEEHDRSSVPAVYGNESVGRAGGSATARLTHNGGEDVVAEAILSLVEELHSLLHAQHGCAKRSAVKEHTHLEDEAAREVLAFSSPRGHACSPTHCEHDTNAVKSSLTKNVDYMTNTMESHAADNDTQIEKEMSHLDDSLPSVSLTIRALDTALGVLTALLASEAPDNGSGIAYNAQKVSYAAVHATVSALVQLSCLLMRAVVAYRDPVNTATTTTARSTPPVAHTYSSSLSHTLSLVLPGLHKSWMALQLITRHAANLPMTYLALYEACDERAESTADTQSRTTRRACSSQRAARLLQDVCTAAHFVALESAAHLAPTREDEDEKDSETLCTALPTQTRLALLETCAALTRATAVHTNKANDDDDDVEDVCENHTECHNVHSSECGSARTHGWPAHERVAPSAEIGERSEAWGAGESAGTSYSPLYSSHAAHYVVSTLVASEAMMSLALSTVMRVHARGPCGDEPRVSLTTTTTPSGLHSCDDHVRKAIVDEKTKKCEDGPAACDAHATNHTRQTTSCDVTAYRHDDFTTMAQSLLLLGHLAAVGKSSAAASVSHTERWVSNVVAVLLVVVKDVRRVLHVMSCHHGKALATLFEPTGGPACPH